MTQSNSYIVGTEIPAFCREGSFQHWNRYAAVNHEFADHHMDDETGRYEGFDAAIGMAPLIHAYMHSMLRDWCDPDNGRILQVSIELRAPFLRGRTLCGGGRIADVSSIDGETHVGLDIWAKDDRDTLLIKGTAAVSFPA